MRCDRAQALLADYQAGALNERQAAAVAAHVAECERCAAELAALERTATLLDATEPRRPSRDLWPGIAAQLKPREAQRAWWRSLVPASPRAALGLAAAVMVIVALMVVLPQHWATPPTVALPQAEDEDAALFAQWHAEASLTSGMADAQALALMALHKPPDAAEALTP